MFIRFRRHYSYVVTNQEEVQKLLNFTENPLVKGFAYVAHSMKNNGNIHYHFYFIMKDAQSSDGMEKMTGIPMERIFFARSSVKDEINYMLCAGDVDTVVRKSFRTNIEGYKKYNGV